MRIIINKLKSAYKIGLLALLISITGNGYAEYYLVYSAPAFACYDRCSRCSCCNYHYMRFVSHHRYVRRGSGEMSEYGWLSPDP